MTAAVHERLELFLPRHLLAARIQEMGAEISRDTGDNPLLLIGVLRGAAVFFADLARAITTDCIFDFVSVSSYGSHQQPTEALRMIHPPEENVTDKHVLLVEDILDTGATLAYLQKQLQAQHPSSLRVAALLDKPARRKHPVQADYVGFTVPDRFVVGYGMDYSGHFRGLPDIYFLPQIIQEE